MLLKTVHSPAGYHIVDLNTQQIVTGPFTTEHDGDLAIKLAMLLKQPTLQQEMLAEGYSMVADVIIGVGYRIDMEVATGPCRHCPGRTHYEGYRKDKSYRAWAVCNSCGNKEEF